MRDRCLDEGGDNRQRVTHQHTASRWPLAELAFQTITGTAIVCADGISVAAGANTRELMERMGHTSPAVALRYQHVMAGRDQAIAAALDELVQAAANLPPERPADPPSGTLVARNRRARSEGPGRRAGGGR